MVGWDGCLYPYTFNVSDFEPITGRVHQPPPVHQVFEGYNFVVCNFVPRKVDYHPLAIPVPYYHSNVDSDEIMFYVAGDYEARKGSGIGRGSISVHPGGHSHGPQTGAVEAALGKDYFDELAVMVDTFRPLELGEARSRGGRRGLRLELVRPRAGRLSSRPGLLPTPRPRGVGRRVASDLGGLTPRGPGGFRGSVVVDRIPGGGDQLGAGGATARSRGRRPRRRRAARRSGRRPAG